jgi:hypothetical protein
LQEVLEENEGMKKELAGTKEELANMKGKVDKFENEMSTMKLHFNFTINQAFAAGRTGKSIFIFYSNKKLRERFFDKIFV